MAITKQPKQGEGADQGEGEGGEDQSQRIEAVINRAVHEKLKAALPKALAGMPWGEIVGEQIKAHLGPLIGAAQEGKQAEAQASQGGAAATDAGGQVAQAVRSLRDAEVRLKESEKRIQLLEAENKAKAEAQAKSEARERSLREDSALTEGFRNLGVLEHHIRPQIALLRAEGRLKTAEDGKLYVVDPGKPEYEQDVPVGEFLTGWAKTDGGKACMPAVGAGGGGNAARGQARGGQKGGAEGMTEAQLIAATVLGYANGGGGTL